MTETLDMIIIGAGPAGLSAAVNARIRGKNILLISGDHRATGLHKAQEIGNYLGFEGLSGATLLDRFLKHARHLGVEPVSSRVLSILPLDGQFMVSYESQVSSARCIILATGVVRKDTFPGEAEFLGRGVSYCATCDGMLYRGKTVCVLGLNQEAEKEAAYLREIGCQVLYFSKKEAVKVKIRGENTVEALEVNGQFYPCAGVFVLRNSVSPATFLPNLAMKDGHIQVNDRLETSIPGIYAAGDCIGGPYQINKAAGEGQKAALNAVEDYLHEKEK